MNPGGGGGRGGGLIYTCSLLVIQCSLHFYKQEKNMFIAYTVNSRYLEVEGTL